MPWKPFECRPLTRQIRLFFSGGHLQAWRNLDTLQDSTLETFRNDAYNPAVPVKLPKYAFQDTPAIAKWFLTSEDQQPISALNHNYLSTFGQAIVPIELTRQSPSSSKDDTTSTFTRSEAPLSFLLQWTKQASADSKDRLYVAQAPLSRLPMELQNDVPTPGLVLNAGKGDVYDANLWMGMSPTYTPLHRDPNPNLFVQLAGRKHVRLLKPETGQELFSRVQDALDRVASAKFRGEEMMQGEEKRLLEAEVWGANQSMRDGYEAVVEMGDSLFIPQGWWHSIKGVGEGVTCSVNWWFR
ncbi:hypothetical protein MMC09_003465 [Bachmanniomyces sp. S44760]|nr:hypothetical protein [Bachmanniomyces sp. S44760]